MKTRIIKATTKSKANRMASLTKDHWMSIRPNYFARFRFNIEDLIKYLNAASGRDWETVPLAFQCLEDLGHWGFVRQSSVFEMTSDLEKELRAQFRMLQNHFTYHVGDWVYWAPLHQPNAIRQRAHIIEKLTDKESTHLFRIQIEGSKATEVVSVEGLDFWNGAGSSLPMDFSYEMIDWEKDSILLRHLSNFKNKLASEGFRFNFLLEGEAMALQQMALSTKIKNYFRINEGEFVQRGRGLGLLACGHGTATDNATVQAYVMQALGQIFGIKARLWENLNASGLSERQVVVTVGRTQRIFSEGNFIVENTDYRPLQRPLSEVLRRVIAAGPFGLAESSQWKAPEFDAIRQNSEEENSETSSSSDIKK